ncbi:MAG: hypothetical protein AAF386_06720, partial [Pseudomonadota bacterium]
FELQQRLGHVRRQLDPKASNDDALVADILDTKLVFTERQYRLVFQSVSKILDNVRRTSRLSWPVPKRNAAFA